MIINVVFAMKNYNFFSKFYNLKQNLGRFLEKTCIIYSIFNIFPVAIKIWRFIGGRRQGLRTKTMVRRIQ